MIVTSMNRGPSGFMIWRRVPLTVGLCELVPVVVILINWLAPVVLGLELEVPLRHALSLLSSLKNSDAFTFTAETGDNRTVYWYGGFVPFVASVPLVGMKFTRRVSAQDFGSHYSLM